MHDHPAIAELRRCQQQLRTTETELGEERQRTADLGRRLATEQQRTEALRQELRMLEAVRHLSGRPLVPEQTAGDCDATWMPKPIKDVPTKGML